MKGQIDTSFETLQRDLFSSGVAAEIGMNAFGVWLAIKSYANFQTGVCYPSVRKLAEATGLSTVTIQKCLKVLQRENLLRIETEGKGTRSNRYVAREKLTVRLGDAVICAIVIDYVPSKMRKRLESLSQALEEDADDDVMAVCDIIPADGFVWDSKTRKLSKRIEVKDLPDVETDSFEEELGNDLTKRLKVLEHKSKKKAK